MLASPRTTASPTTPSVTARATPEIRARLRAALRGSDLGIWPSRAWLAARGGAELVAAVVRSGGPSRWSHQLGLPGGCWRGQRWTPDTIAAALASVLAGRRTWPSKREFEAAGLAGLHDTIARTEGHPAAAARYELALRRPDRHRSTRHRSASHGRDH